MPYFYDPNLDQDKQQEQASNGQSVNISGASQAYNQNGTPQQPNNNSKDLNTGSGFQNLDKYLQVNNAQDFGNQFQGKVKDQINSVQNDMNQASDQFKDQVNSLNQTPTSEQVNQAISDPTHADPTQFQKWEKQTYQGPHSLAENQDLWNKYWSGVNQAQTNTQMLGTDAGRFTLLDQYYGRPTYNFGEKSLDNLLYQESGLGSQTKALQDQAAQLKSQGNQGDEVLQNYATQKATQVENSRNLARSAMGLDDQGNVIQGENAGALGKYYQSVNDAVQSQNSQRQSDFSQIQKDLQSGSLTPAELQALGLSAGQQIYNLDLSKYLSQGQDLTRDQVMTPDQRAQIQALSQMAGITDTFANGTQQDSINPYSFNMDSFKNELNDTQTNYWNALKDATNRANQIVSQTAAQKGETLNDMGQDPFLQNEFNDIYGTSRDSIQKQYGINRTLNQTPFTRVMGPMKRPGG